MVSSLLRVRHISTLRSDLDDMEVFRPTDCPNVMSDGHHLYTRNLVPGHAIYGEPLVNAGGEELRRWDQRRSKMAAYMLLSHRCGDLGRNDTVLYLGAATGTTVSHISDIVDEGRVYAVEVSKRAFRGLLSNCSDRPNVVPILGNARDADLLSGILSDADYLYVDVAQRDEVDIFLFNMGHHSCRTGMLMLKCRSIDVAAIPISIAQKTLSTIRKSGYNVEQPIDLGAFAKDHFAILVKRPKA